MEVEQTGNRISFMECVLFAEHAIVIDKANKSLDISYCLLETQ